MTRVKCPFCASSHGTEVECFKTGETIPRSFIRNAHKVKPLWLLTAGFTRHGKSTFIGMQTLHLATMCSVLPGMFYRHSDDPTKKAIQKMRQNAINGEQVERTQIDGPNRPLLFNIHNIPGFGSRALVLYDLPGQLFDSFEMTQEHGSIFKQVSTLWFVVSLTDLQHDDSGRTITDLFDVYVNGMERIGVDLSDWTLIVIYTKADKCRSLMDNDEYLQDYLADCPMKAIQTEPDSAEVWDLEAYIAEMEEISRHLEIFTRKHVPDGIPFIQMVKSMDMNLVFSINTALGANPDENGKMATMPEPKRVIDPFLWALKLNIPQCPSKINLIIDMGLLQNAEAQQVILQFWEVLTEIGDVYTFQLGLKRPLAGPDKEPTLRKTKTSTSPLIGPVLDAHGGEGISLILIKRMPLDLSDFKTSYWNNRVLYINAASEESWWPNEVAWLSGKDFDQISQMAIDMLKEI